MLLSKAVRFLLLVTTLNALKCTSANLPEKTGEFAQGAMDAMKHPERRRALLARITNAMNAQLQKISQHSWVEKMITMTNRFNHCLRRAAGTLRKAAYEIYNIFVEEFKGVNS
ncbi:uncharacterized protein LOC111262829 isoform X2 [Varroa jacobsoni]|uniref:uncharacterized protein LOC111262829 isoform X2 n=1 Tax=Varroa jacobsoni TaxID=62625 RepID=UPI000BF3AF4B|nr:uncharacterized protein LOC111262829 isoform X2 [Varroa jacobsoni]